MLSSDSEPSDGARAAVVSRSAQPVPCTLLAEHSTELQSLNVFGCRGLGADALNALLRVVGPSLRALNLNGAIGTQDVTHEELLIKCPGLARLEDNGRVRKW